MRKNKEAKLTSVYSWIFRNKKGVVLLLFSLLIVAMYFYHWFGEEKSENVEILEPIVSSESVVEEEMNFSEVVAEDVDESDLIAARISDNDLLDIYTDYLPDIQDIPHVSAILKLRSAPVQEKVSVPDVVSKDVKDGHARIAIVIDDMGASPARTKDIIAIKAPLTSSFVTFASQLKKQAEQAKKAGHELMIHVPMQPKSNIYVSDDVLKVDMTQKQIHDTFSSMLAKFDGVVGVNNHMGSLFTEHEDKLVPVMQLLSQHHLFFLDSKTTPYSQGEKVARNYQVPSVHRHVFLDNENNLEYILRQLEKTENIARKNGYAIAIGHPKSQTSLALAVWLKTLPEKGIELVPLSQIVSTLY